MPGLLPNIDPDGLLEFSVVYTDRALNHMSKKFQGVMKDIAAMLKEVYHADAAVLVPGSGTFGMESVARQFAGDQRVVIIRNGFFSFRWSQILETGRITAPENIAVLKARRTGGDAQSPWAPAPIDEVVSTIASVKPAVVFAPHVETASGMMLPDDYMKKIADAVHVWAACSCWTASPRARCGWTCRPSVSMCWSARRKRAGARRPPARWSACRIAR